ncbi:MAG: hypothetical protein WBS22_16790 [Methylocystis sp.]
MITIKECADLAGIAPDELGLYVLPAARHKSLLASYLLNLQRGEKAVCRQMVGDFWRLMELGAKERAGDVFHVLRLFLSTHPRAKRELARADSGN